MKTRAEIYGHEAAGLLRSISMYPGLSTEQLCRFYPDKENKIPAVLLNLQKQGRISVNADGEYFTGREPKDNPDSGIHKAVWVLLDFIEKVEFHCAGDFPVHIVFFAGGEMYEVVYVEKGKEALVVHLLNQDKAGSGKRIILVEDAEQIAQLEIAGTSGFCTVSKRGRVQYYKKS